jgi:hypothetical protein
MHEIKKAELLRRKALLFKFLSFQMRVKDSFWGDDDDFQALIDDILDQVIRINKRLREDFND